ncbi:DUF5665 domain-containing protein [Rhodalgimonas zhirmunskyi]|uniref:DUF5665 domain-containing protein n=1 Tax=Rhodalgimonas zhirmunskyi TaxID=2964767 RepID=A0AAJ1X663_9RHOB|nr:DUF5665 domain-containing protein [Rhodoalgimonas zhirmunskyi]MDQ2094864.1 DUF5665 domain-containing protein [Rhodoalgimonas zhirmunskyi]
MDARDQETLQAETEALNRLAQEVERLNTHRFVALHNKPLRLLTFQFFRGMAFGLGSVVGATILVSVVAWWLAQFQFLPIVGDWVSQISQQIERDKYEVDR